MVSLSAVAPVMGLPSFNHWRDNGGVPMNSAEKVVASPAPTLRQQVVVTATFPYKEQIALYLRALRIEGETEAKKEVTLFNDGLAPKLAGLNVYRRSYGPVTKKASARALWRH